MGHETLLDQQQPANQQMAQIIKSCLPFFAKGKVVKGFGRGSKELGIPTANLPDEVIEVLPQEMDTGIYYGFANVDGGPVYKMVMSIGWNPYYKNVKKSMEAHLLHVFPEDFYGSLLRVCVLGYVRPECSFNSLEDLITAIHSDIAKSESELEKPEHTLYQRHSFFCMENISSDSNVQSGKPKTGSSL